MSNKNIDEYNRMKLYEPLMPKVIGKVELTDEDKRLAKITQEQYDELEKDRE